MQGLELSDFLNEAVHRFERPDFIEDDPIKIPHRFSAKQDVEISGLFASLLAWGQRKTILNKVNQLMHLMDESPYDFIKNHKDQDLKRFVDFKHRTFNSTDLLFVIRRLKECYLEHDSLECVFKPSQNQEVKPFGVRQYIENFHTFMFDADYAPQRSRKHISTPVRGSACKRINMYLRWMVRPANKGVDFGIWEQVKPSELVMPLDVHVLNISEKLGLLKQGKANWKTAVHLTDQMIQLDPEDPVKYDLALFGLGVTKYFDG